MTFSPSRFVLRVLKPSRPGVLERETVILVDRNAQPALVIEPAKAAAHRPGWILLHGLTVAGRHHAGVLRLGRALAGAGAVVICPEVAQWTRLRVDSRPVHSTLVAATTELADRGVAPPQRIGALAFSIAVPAVLAAVSREPLTVRVAVVGGFGASCDMHRTVRCALTGEHEWKGKNYRLQPDPYGRWIVGANFVGDLRSDGWGTPAERAAVAERLHVLAVTAGRNGAYSGDPVYDPLKERLAEGLSAQSRALWSLFAPPSRQLPDDLSAAGSLADALADAVMRRYPDFDARPCLARVAAKVHLVHGFGDQLVPFTETLRLASAFPPDRPARATITPLFGHAPRQSQGARPRLSPSSYLAELVRLARALNDLAGAV